MIDFNVKVEFNNDKIKSKLQKKLHKAQEVLDSEVLKDSNYYIPHETGKMEESGTANTVIGSGKIIWQTDYVQRQYYGNYSHKKQRNPHATRLWFEAAKARFIEEWRKLVRECFTRS